MQNAQLKDVNSISLEPDFDYHYGNQNVSNHTVNNVKNKVTNGPSHFDNTNISPDAIIFTNEKGEVRYINLEAQELTGWYITDAMNKKVCEVFNIYDSQSLDQLDDPISKVLETDSKIELTRDIILKSKDNLKFEIQYKASPKYKDSGELNKIILTFKKLREIEDTKPSKEQTKVKAKLPNKPKELSINELSFNDIDNDAVIKIEEKNGKTENVNVEKKPVDKEKEISLKVVTDKEDMDTEILGSPEVEISSTKAELKENFNSMDEGLSIDLEIDDEPGRQISDSSEKDGIDYDTKTVKKIDSDLPEQKSNIYSISTEDLHDIDSLDFLDDI